MTWFKVDDGLPTSKAVLRIPRKQRCQAVGLWTLSGTWCAKELTDGFVPDYLLDEFGATKKTADLLVAAELWRAVNGGWQFVGWTKYNPTREQVLAEREKEADRKRRWREAKADKSRQRPGGTPPSVPPESDAESALPVPTRPDPSRPVPVGTYVPTDGSPPDVSPDRARDETDEPPRGRAVDVDGWKLVRDVIPADHPQAVRTALAMHAGAMLQQGIDATQVRAALDLWLTKPKLGPGVLPSLVSEVMRARAAPAPNGSHLSPREAEFVRVELMKDNPNPEVLRRAGIEPPRIPNLTALPGGA
ncbi:hypothetical protein [Nocardia aurea]|uniref:hypothetical protein n=1 Tax=Nocardia aurea TaxID=2144174 RepID=UPI0033AD3147